MIIVESPGLLTTVQDLGRPGYGAMGVSASGAADPIALRIANLLVGNQAGAAALEMTMIGGRYRFTEDATIALAGARTSAPGWAAISVKAGDRVEIGPCQQGSRVYLAVRGGIEVPLFLGSASTHLLSGLGGFHGRALRKEDCLSIGPAVGSFVERRIRKEALARLAPRKTLRVTYGAQVEWFTDEDRARFATLEYRVTQQSDRMGIRLAGPALTPQGGHHMVTEGVALGAVQIPADGQPILLFVEQQTTGGYPKIANVIAADLASLGQLRPGDTIRFEWTTIPVARALLAEQEAVLAPEELFA